MQSKNEPDSYLQQDEVVDACFESMEVMLHLQVNANQVIASYKQLVSILLSHSEEREFLYEQLLQCLTALSQQMQQYYGFVPYVKIVSVFPTDLQVLQQQIQAELVEQQNEGPCLFSQAYMRQFKTNEGNNLNSLETIARSLLDNDDIKYRQLQDLYVAKQQQFDILFKNFELEVQKSIEINHKRDKTQKLANKYKNQLLKSQDLLQQSQTQFQENESELMLLKSQYDQNQLAQSTNMQVVEEQQLEIAQLKEQLENLHSDQQQKQDTILLQSQELQDLQDEVHQLRQSSQQFEQMQLSLSQVMQQFTDDDAVATQSQNEPLNDIVALSSTILRFKHENSSLIESLNKTKDSYQEQVECNALLASQLTEVREQQIQLLAANNPSNSTEVQFCKQQFQLQLNEMQQKYNARMEDITSQLRRQEDLVLTQKLIIDKQHKNNTDNKMLVKFQEVISKLKQDLSVVYEAADVSWKPDQDFNFPILVDRIQFFKKLQSYTKQLIRKVQIMEQNQIIIKKYVEALLPHASSQDQQAMPMVQKSALLSGNPFDIETEQYVSVFNPLSDLIQSMQYEVDKVGLNSNARDSPIKISLQKSGFLADYRIPAESNSLHDQFQRYVKGGQSSQVLNYVDSGKQDPHQKQIEKLRNDDLDQDYAERASKQINNADEILDDFEQKNERRNSSIHIDQPQALQNQISKQSSVAQSIDPHQVAKLQFSADIIAPVNNQQNKEINLLKNDSEVQVQSILADQQTQQPKPSNTSISQQQKEDPGKQPPTQVDNDYSDIIEVIKMPSIDQQKAVSQHHNQSVPRSNSSKVDEIMDIFEQKNELSKSSLKQAQALQNQSSKKLPITHENCDRKTIKHEDQTFVEEPIINVTVNSAQTQQDMSKRDKIPPVLSELSSLLSQKPKIDEIMEAYLVSDQYKLQNSENPKKQGDVVVNNALNDPPEDPEQISDFPPLESLEFGDSVMHIPQNVTQEDPTKRTKLKIKKNKSESKSSSTIEPLELNNFPHMDILEVSDPERSVNRAQNGQSIDGNIQKQSSSNAFEKHNDETVKSGTPYREGHPVSFEEAFLANTSDTEQRNPNQKKSRKLKKKSQQ